MRTLIIGDIHGSIASLKEVLDKAFFDTSKDRLICLGDYIDGWKGAVEVVNLLLDIKKASRYPPIFILGNHDLWLIHLLNKDYDRFRDETYIYDQYANWIFQGGAVTYGEYLKIPETEVIRHRDEFYNQLVPYHLENNFLYVHAGFDTVLGFEQTLAKKPQLLQWDRSLYQQAYASWQMQSTTDGAAETKRFGDFERIYIGHTPTFRQGINHPKPMHNVLNLDQGCKVNGRLTAWVYEEDVFFQSSVMKNPLN